MPTWSAAKRRGLGLIALALCCLLGFGAWARSSPAPERVSILMPAPFADATTDLVEAFNRSHPQIALSVSRGPLDTEAMSDLAISSLLLGGSPYDLLLMDVTWTPKYAAAGWLEPLEPWLGQEALADLAPGAELGNAFDGHLWRFPLVADMGLLYWRTDLMDRAPRTPAELEQISRTLQARGDVPWGFVWEGKQYEGLSCVMVELLRGFGGHWLEDGELQLDSPEAVAATAWLEGLVDQGITPPSVANMAEPEALQAFESGDAALMRNWPYAWALLNRIDSPLRGKVGITTMVSEPGQPHAATQGSWGLALLADSPHKTAAVEVLRFLTSTEAQKQLNLRWGYTPTRLSVFHDPELLAANPVLHNLEEALEVSVLRPLTPVYAQLSDLLYRGVNTAISEAIEAPEAMAKLQTNSERLLQTSKGVR